MSLSHVFTMSAYFTICVERGVLDKSTAADINAALVSSRLDYANSVFYCSRIQNSVARIVLQQPSLSSRDTPQQLHWLPVK